MEARAQIGTNKSRSERSARCHFQHFQSANAGRYDLPGLHLSHSVDGGQGLRTSNIQPGRKLRAARSRGPVNVQRDGLHRRQPHDQTGVEGDATAVDQAVAEMVVACQEEMEEEDKRCEEIKNRIRHYISSTLFSL